MTNKHLIVVGGATATGKTEVSIALASRLGAEILSADSRQFYREMSIGTAKPSPEERAGIPHHFIDSLSVTQSYSVGDFERDAIALLNQLFQTHHIALLVGGSGLFIRAVCEGLDDFPVISEETIERVKQGETAGGLNWLQQQLAELDPAYFAVVDRQNPARLRRALQVSLESGRPYSGFLTRSSAKRSFECHHLLLERPRNELYERIDVRVDAMIAAGLEAEALALLPYRHLQALRTVGYEEWFYYFDGLAGYQETISKIKQHTRNYAKRQATWFKKQGHWNSFNPENKEEIFNWVKEKIK